MEITKTIKTQSGAEFTANLTEKEVDFLLEFAINSLLARGVLPFTVVHPEEASSIAPTSQELQ